MPFLNGFEASIVVKETEVLPAYGVVIDEFNRTSTCYIPAEGNRKFRVVWKCLNNLVESRGDVFIDGTGAGSEVIHRGSKQKVEKKHTTLGFPSQLQFVFPRKTDMDEQITNASTEDVRPIVSNHAGEIRLLIYRINILDRNARISDPDASEDIERIATFIFKYRTIEFLSMNNIQDQEPTILPAIKLNEIEEQNVPSASGISLSVPSAGDNVSMQDDDEAVDLEIIQLQGRLNVLYAKRGTKERAKFKDLYKGKGHVDSQNPERLLKKAKTTAQRQRIEAELRNLPKRPGSRRVQKQRATENLEEQPAEMELLELGPEDHF